MLKHRWTDRICCVVLALTLLITATYMGAAGAGLIVKAERTGYEKRLFDSSRVHSIEIVMDNWDGFLSTCTNEEYASCTAVIDGEKYGNVAIRAKGNTSLSSVASYGNNRYSFKIEFDHFVSGKTYYGLDKLCLNNIIQDNTYMKDYLAYTLMKKMGVAAPLCSYAYITVNGKDWGLYLAVEAVEDAFLTRNYSGQGELYKPDSMSFGGGRGNGRDFNMDEFRERFQQENSDATTQTASDDSAWRGGGFDPFSGAQQDANSQGGQAPSFGAQPGADPFAGFGQNTNDPQTGNTAPNMEGNMPENGNMMPSNAGGTMPNGENAMPSNAGGTMPNGENAMPSNAGGTMPNGENAMPSNAGGTMPNGENAMPSNAGGTMPNGENDTFPNMGGNMPGGKNGFPGANGTFPNAEEGFQGGYGVFPDAEGGFPMDMPGMGGNGGDFGGKDGMGSADVQLQYIDDNPDSYSNIFENAKTDVSEEDQKRLIASLKALSEGDASVVEQDAVLRYMAVHNFLVNDDSYTGMMVHNYYLHEDNGILSMIPWDYNLSMGGMGMNGSDATETVNSPIDTLVSSGEASSRPMAAWITADEETLTRYHAVYQEFVDKAVSEGWLTSELEATFELIAPFVAKDPTAFCTYEEFLKAQEALKEFCALRLQSVEGQLSGTIPSTSQAQKTDRSALIDASNLSLADMGSMNNEMGGGMPDFNSEGQPSAFPGAPSGDMPFTVPGFSQERAAGGPSEKSANAPGNDEQNDDIRAPK